MDIPLSIKVAMRFHVANMVRMRQDFPDPDLRGRPHYVRLMVIMSLPVRDPYLQKIQAAAAKATKTIPFLRRTDPVHVTLDLPISHDQRKDAIAAIRRLPFVDTVIVGSGPPIR